MKKFQSVRNGQVAELVSENEKQIIVKLESGEEKALSPATLKRWWKPMEEEEELVEEQPQSEEEVAEAEENADEQTEANQVVEEEPVAKIEKKAKKPAKKKTIDNPHPLKKVIEDLAAELNTEVTTATVPTFKSLKVEGKRYAAFTFDEESVILWLYSEAVEGLTDYRKINHILDARVKFEGTDIEKVTELIKASLAFTKAKMAAKKTK